MTKENGITWAMARKAASNSCYLCPRCLFIASTQKEIARHIYEDHSATKNGDIMDYAEEKAVKEGRVDEDEVIG